MWFLLVFKSQEYLLQSAKILLILTRSASLPEGAEAGVAPEAGHLHSEAEITTRGPHPQLWHRHSPRHIPPHGNKFISLPDKSDNILPTRIEQRVHSLATTP